METPTNKTILALLKEGGISAALIAVLIYFGTLFVNSVSDIQKDLNSIRLELVKIQSSLLTEQRVEKIVDEKIEKTILKYHNNDK